MTRALGGGGRQAFAAACDEVEGHHQALKEARKQAESTEGHLEEEMVLHERAEAEARKAAEDLREVKEVADATNATRVSIESDVDTLREVVVNMRRELEEVQASEGALRLECQQLTILASKVARITFDTFSGIGARCPPLPSDSEASVMPLFWLWSAMKVMVRATEVYARSSACVATALQLTLLHEAGVGPLEALEQ